MATKTQPNTTTKPPIRWTGILFAFAANTLLVTALSSFLPAGGMGDLATILGPILAGVVTAIYVGQRGGMHAFIGGLISIPVLALFILSSDWQSAVIAGAFCGFGGSLTEIIMRRRG
ncbi:MAG: hypothetical protein AAF639_03430 [Chloroflexota bacterium]